MTTSRILQTISGIAGVGALTLGLLFWIAHVELINIHMLFGLIVALVLLIVGILAISARGLRIWGIVCIIYAAIVPIFGVTQSSILIGDLHWLIQSLHLLVGIGALALTGIIATRYARSRHAIPSSVRDAQAVRQG